MKQAVLPRCRSCDLDEPHLGHAPGRRHAGGSLERPARESLVHGSCSRPSFVAVAVAWLLMLDCCCPFVLFCCCYLLFFAIIFVVVVVVVGGGGG